MHTHTHLQSRRLVCAIFGRIVCVLTSIRVAAERGAAAEQMARKNCCCRVADRERRGLRVDASNIVVVADRYIIIWTTLQMREGVKSIFFFLPSRSGSRVVAAYRRWPEGETHIFSYNINSSNDGAILLYLMWYFAYSVVNRRFFIRTWPAINILKRCRYIIYYIIF